MAFFLCGREFGYPSRRTLQGLIPLAEDDSEFANIFFAIGGGLISDMQAAGPGPRSSRQSATVPMSRLGIDRHRE